MSSLSSKEGRKLTVIIGPMYSGKTTKLKTYICETTKLFLPFRRRYDRELKISNTIKHIANPKNILTDDLLSLSESEFIKFCFTVKENICDVVISSIPFFITNSFESFNLLKLRIQMLYYIGCFTTINVTTLCLKDKENNYLYIPIAYSDKGERVGYINTTPGDIKDIDKITRYNKRCETTVTLKNIPKETFQDILSTKLKIYDNKKVFKYLDTIKVIKQKKGIYDLLFEYEIANKN